MREIKFRVWDGKEMISSGNPPAFGFWKYAAYDSDCLKTLMQFTGLKDKNGIEIYQGDALQYPNNDIVIVYYGFYSYEDEYTNEGNGFYLINQRGNTFRECVSSWTNYAQIIGNIYETPSLLTEGTKTDL